MARTLKQSAAGTDSVDNEERRRNISEGGSTPPHALVVDDDADYRTWIVSIMKRLGFAADAAADGADALECVRRSHVDVVIVDQAMPRMSGIELIRAIRKDSVSRSAYAVMLTGYDDTEAKLAALEAGFDDFVSKTASAEEIAAKLAVARRIAERQHAVEGQMRELYGMATRDELTGAYNRRFFIAETERLLASGARTNVILFDLDDFKQINDRFGHVIGDAVLRDIGALFIRSTRMSDLFARYGGDEFVMAIAHLAVVDIEHIAARLAHDIRTLRWSVAGTTFGIGVTTGIASSHLLDLPLLSHLLNAADRDLYKNKWLRKHPEARPELYEYPPASGVTDVSNLMVLPSSEKASDLISAMPVAFGDDTLPPRPRV